MTDELYEDRILEHYETPFHRGSCALATHAFEDSNPLCGDHVRMEARVNADGVIDDVCFTGEGCCVCLAAASMMAEWSNQRPTAEVLEFNAQDMLKLFGPRLLPLRQRCCLLGWRVLRTALTMHSPANQDRLP